MPFAKMFGGRRRRRSFGPVCGFPSSLVQFVFLSFFSGQPQELIRLSGIQEQGAATATAVVASREEDGCASLMLIKKYPRLGRRRRGGGVK